jgi:hypothetical protein
MTGTWVAAAIRESSGYSFLQLCGPVDPITIGAGRKSTHLHRLIPNLDLKFSEVIGLLD